MKHLHKHIDLKKIPIAKKIVYRYEPKASILVLQNICLGTLYLWTWSIAQFICLPTVRKSCKRVFNE